MLDAAFWLVPQRTVGIDYVSPANALLAGLWCAVALGLALALRAGSYAPLLRGVLAIIDPVIVLTLFVVIFESLRGTPKVMHPVVVTAAACTLIAVSGALRLSRRAAAASGVASVAVFVVVSLVIGYTLAEALFVCGLIAAAGLLGMRLTENTRRAVASAANEVILRRFLPPQLVAVDPRAALELVSTPRSVEATIIVTDLRGFTASVEKLEPVAALAFLNEVQGELAACVREHGGTVDKFMGDGMLAVFGAPEPMADHAAAALRAVLDMRAAMTRLNTRRGGSDPLRIGVGVHSGPVVAGCVGSGERLEFTVIGDTVNTASRLEAATKERGVDILISESTAANAGATAALTLLGKIALRGKEQPLNVYQVARRGG